MGWKEISPEFIFDGRQNYEKVRRFGFVIYARVWDHGVA